MSASIDRVENTTTDWNLEFNYKLRPMFFDIDPNIDDPVNDTGHAPCRGDLQMSNEFACLLNVIAQATENSEDARGN